MASARRFKRSARSSSVRPAASPCASSLEDSSCTPAPPSTDRRPDCRCRRWTHTAAPGVAAWRCRSSCRMPVPARQASPACPACRQARRHGGVSMKPSWRAHRQLVRYRPTLVGRSAVRQHGLGIELQVVGRQVVVGRRSPPLRKSARCRGPVGSGSRGCPGPRVAGLSLAYSGWLTAQTQIGDSTQTAPTASSQGRLAPGIQAPSMTQATASRLAPRCWRQKLVQSRRAEAATCAAVVHSRRPRRLIVMRQMRAHDGVDLQRGRTGQGGEQPQGAAQRAPPDRRPRAQEMGPGQVAAAGKQCGQRADQRAQAKGRGHQHSALSTAPARRSQNPATAAPGWPAPAGAAQVVDHLPQVQHAHVPAQGRQPAAPAVASRHGSSGAGARWRHLGQHRVLLDQRHVAQVRGAGPDTFVEVVAQQAVGRRIAPAATWCTACTSSKPLPEKLPWAKRSW